MRFIPSTALGLDISLIFLGVLGRAVRGCDISRPFFSGCDGFFIIRLCLIVGVLIIR